MSVKVSDVIFNLAIATLPRAPPCTNATSPAALPSYSNPVKAPQNKTTIPSKSATTTSNTLVMDFTAQPHIKVGR